ncbi:MAG: bifunctional diaminohydroxyphosphoribosylaminopyrimidine deaminase/5-amino-6-(5-phosphoribosylamino)uracil reductase RibD, partial [Bacteroidales bacterium]|nr:bifunctional diaminohydroxyphosphoribosylaminopyrimidine deaminase/5-amino-6-(5-phosphoribosylamino)uracil reductase RibD [Bacteroidales bacterium]
MTINEKYMQRCLELAVKGRNHVAPNPMVGCVIIRDGIIIGEGYHQQYGEAHAEVNAINSVLDKKQLKESTLFVNLEPCAHHGKTPPCSELIVRMKIPRVVIGCQDSFAEVSGKGIERMRQAGIEVSVGILEKESLDLNKRFFTFHEKKRPYIILKWAQTLDGYIDIIRKPKDPIGINWITHPNLKLPVHKWRAEEEAIMVGGMTALNDNPNLGTREWFGDNPLRILVNRDMDLARDLQIFDNSIPTLVFTQHPKVDMANLKCIYTDFDADPLKQILDKLYSME